MEMKDLVDILHSGNHSLVVANGDVAVFDGHGVQDVYSLLSHRPGILDNARVADKVVGKGAAALMILGKVRELHADVISLPALELLAHSDMEVTYALKVPNIINRKGDGICPVEKKCMPCTSPEECLTMIKEFFNTLTHK